MRKGFHLDDLKMNYGDFFILMKLGENLNPIVFSELLQELIYHVIDNDDDDEKKSLTKDHKDDSDVKKSKNSLIVERL